MAEIKQTKPDRTAPHVFTITIQILDKNITNPNYELIKNKINTLEPHADDKSIIYPPKVEYNSQEQLLYLLFETKIDLMRIDDYNTPVNVLEKAMEDMVLDYYEIIKQSL